MVEYFSFKTRLYFTAIVTIAIWSLLAWNYYHGGVPAHHILDRKDLPAISNWWGGLLLPLLTWFLLYRIQKRIFHNDVVKLQALKFPMNVPFGFIGAFLFGILLSAFFVFGFPDIPSYMLMGLFAVALFLPIYRAECILGFVIGMTYTFGAVLPTAIGSIIALICVVLYLYIRPAIFYMSSKIFNIRKSSK